MRVVKLNHFSTWEQCFFKQEKLLKSGFSAIFSTLAEFPRNLFQQFSAGKSVFSNFVSAISRDENYKKRFQQFSPRSGDFFQKIIQKIAEKHSFQQFSGVFSKIFTLFRWIFSQTLSAIFSAILAAKRRNFFQHFFFRSDFFSAISRNL